MYQDGFFIGIVEQAQKREYTHTSGSINTTKDIFGNKNIEGDIDTTLMISYEFKLQGHSEVFHKDGEHVIQAGDKMIFEAVKNGHGIFELGVCKNFTHGWIVGGSSRMWDMLKIPINIILASIVSYILIGIIIVVLGSLIPTKEYEIYIKGLYYLICAAITAFFIIKFVKSALNKGKINKEFREMQFPENFNKLNNLQAQN
ncbi:hypothetical protein [Campylobacter helveticus]|uniref:hypothetical protein n=1 Tax=Campylobacter helveticus TaxID=28898 RepID=UPI00104B39A1|nr:hypothetical protein [Campylobacter helveticus]QBL12185.1 hypothetical protein A0073_07090 [Campylobacter helveticus]